MKKKILLYLCCLSSALTLTACQSSTVEQNNKSSETVNIENTETQINTETETLTEEQTLESQIEIATRGCEVIEEGETVNLDGVSFTVNDVTVTRKKGDWYDFLEPELDAEGNLPENKAYVIVNTTITQNGENDFWLNSIWLGFFDYDLKIGQIEMDGTTLLKEDNGDSDIFQNLINDGDTITTDLIFIIKQEEMKDAHFLLLYDKSGLGAQYADPEEFCMVYLKSLENVWDADTLK